MACKVFRQIHGYTIATFGPDFEEGKVIACITISGRIHVVVE